MGKDTFPYKYLLVRAFDIALYIFIALCSVLLYFLSSWLTAAKFGTIILVLGLYQEYRQQSYYSKNHIENSLLSSGLVIYPINEVAKLRACLAKSNIILIIAGTIFSGWGAFA